jgi:oligoribonuclease
VSDILLWVDVETTGFVPECDRLLEVAMQPTTFDATFAEIGRPFHVVIHPGRDLKVADVSPEVLAMHSANGLWKDVRGANALSPHSFRDLRDRFLHDWRIYGHDVYLAGRSVHFDRAWLRKFVPDEMWMQLSPSHRHFDLTAIKAFLTLTGHEFGVPEETHRALQDVRDDIALARKLAEPSRGAGPTRVCSRRSPAAHD